MRTLSAFWLRRMAFAFATLIFILSGSSIPGEAFANGKYAGIVMDAKTGKVLYSHKADATRYPASLTKMMTMYMMFEAIDDGKLSKKSRIRISKYAASKPPSKLGIKPGRSISAEHAILALATKSANDVAAAVAEHLGGSESEFGVMMTRKARQLGLSRTTFKNASGLTQKGQVTTARDMARLGIALREHFPHHYKYFSSRSFKYGKHKYGNHNRLLGRIKGVDGIKTGYTRASGFNLVSSVEKDNRSIVAVVLGGRSGKSRNAQMQKLISKYLRKASRGSKKQLIASRKPSGAIVVAALGSNFRLPARGPVPVFRSTTVAKPVVSANRPIQVASAVSATSAGFKSGSDFDQKAVLERLLQGKAPVPSARPTAALGYVDEVRTAAVPAKTQPAGWVIQIGASDSHNKAIGLLEKARGKAPAVLNNKGLYTETVDKNGTTLHRARFTGFASKDAAWDACKLLKRKNFACLALNT